MTITSKYAGRCRQCGEAIRVGDRIEWSKGEGARHPACVGSTRPHASASAQRAPAQRRSRDYSLARRNYEATGDYYGSGLYDEES